MLGLAVSLTMLAVAAPADTAPAGQAAAPALESTPASQPAASAPPPRPPRESVRIVYTGDLGGIGSARTSFSVVRRLEDAAHSTGTEWSTGTLEHGFLTREGHLLRADGSIQAVLDFARGGAVRCTGSDTDWVLTQTSARVLFPEQPDRRLARMLEATLSPAQAWSRQSCTNAAGATATLWSPPGAAPPSSFSPEGWEFRRALHNDQGVFIVGRPLDEASRRVHRIAALQGLRGGTPSLFVDAGNFVDGASSILQGELSLHRSLGFQILQRLGPSVLAPGETELVAGARTFIDNVRALETDDERAPDGDLALPYIATNWELAEGADPELELPDAKVVTVETDSGPLRIGFVAILSPTLTHRAPKLGRDGVLITDPVEAVQPVVDRLYDEGVGVDLVVGLTTAEGTLLARLRRELRGIDVLIGDPTFATLRVSRREAELRDLPPDLKGAPLTTPMDGLATLDIVFEGQPRRASRVGIASVHLTEDSPRDMEVGRQVMKTRMTAYPALDRPLLGAPATGVWTTDAWEDLVCKAVLQQVDGDVALLRKLPPPPSYPGPASALAVVDSLALLDTLEVHRIPGSNMQRLADRSTAVPVVCGLTPGARLYSVGGRYLDVDRSYRIVTTSATVSGTVTGEILAGLRSSYPLDKPGVKPILEEDGTPLSLNAAALARMESLATDGVVQDTETIIRDEAPAEMRPLWLLRMRQISLSTTSFEGVEDDTTFAAVPETLLTSPSSFTFGTTGDLALEYTSARLWTDLRFRTSYTELRVGEEEPEETADDWILSTSWALPGAALPPAAKLQFMPFTELAYDSDYTPVELEDGTLSTHQSDLSLTLGMAALRAGALRALRTGAFVNRDMARLDDKPAEYGGKLDWETWKRLGTPVTWTTLGTVQLWANTPDDDESDLRLRALAETRLAFALARWLNISAYGQGLLVRGRVPTTSEYAATWTLGLSLDAVGALRL